MRPTLICGLGSTHGDDQLGWQVVERLAATLIRDGVSIRAARSPAKLLDWLAGIDCLIVCDACQEMGSPGALHRWRWPDVPHASLRCVGSHDLGLAAVLALAEELSLLPAEVIIWVAEATVLSPGALSSRSMDEAVAHIVAAIGRDLS